jgi:hypothetical protein
MDQPVEGINEPSTQNNTLLGGPDDLISFDNIMTENRRANIALVQNVSVYF